MKVEKFDEATKYPLVGKHPEKIEVEIVFSISKSVGKYGKKPGGMYSLTARMTGLDRYDGGRIFSLGSYLTEEEVIKNKGNFLGKISLFHKDLNKYNL